MPTIAFPMIDPVAVELGPIAIRWYALAYLIGFIGGWRYSLWLADRFGARPNREDIDLFLTWAVVGVILGGRLGYVLVYNLPYYAANPFDAFKIWHGGMAFHGGLIGVILAVLLFAWRRGVSAVALGDIIACATPIGLLFGRIANFVNGELYGRVSDVAWAMVFPRGGPLPRHPSQLYEAALEGLVLFVVMAVLAMRPGVRARTGTLTGAFLIGYAIARIIGELFREPDIQIGFLIGGTTMGQLLSVPMLLAGVAFVALARAPRPGLEPPSRA